MFIFSRNFFIHFRNQFFLFYFFFYNTIWRIWKRPTTKNGIGFYVLKESKAGEETVTLIYDGSITGFITVYDEAIPGTHDASTELEEAVIDQKYKILLTKKVKNGELKTNLAYYQQQN